MSSSIYKAVLFMSAIAAIIVVPIMIWQMGQDDENWRETANAQATANAILKEQLEVSLTREARAVVTQGADDSGEEQATAGPDLAATADALARDSATAQARVTQLAATAEALDEEEGIEPGDVYSALLEHFDTSVGTGAFERATFSTGRAPFTEDELWNNDQFGKHQRIQIDTHPGLCDKARYDVDRLWVSGTPGMRLKVAGEVVGNYTAAADPHGYIIWQNIAFGDEICVENVGPEGFMILLGPHLYYHYDTYCFRTNVC